MEYQIPDVAYHGTSKEAWKDIKKNGLKSYIGYVYMVDDKDVAARFGEVVLKIDLTKLNPENLDYWEEMLCRIYKCNPFINHLGDIPPEAITKL